MCTVSTVELVILFEKAGYDAINCDGARSNTVYYPKDENIDYFKTEAFTAWFFHGTSDLF